MSITVDYVLCASGLISLPNLDIIIDAADNAMAVAMAEKKGIAISSAGYVKFYLYDVKNDHKLIYSFRTENLGYDVVM